jgi:hypothetical protein
VDFPKTFNQFISGTIKTLYQLKKCNLQWCYRLLM